MCVCGGGDQAEKYDFPLNINFQLLWKQVTNFSTNKIQQMKSKRSLKSVISKRSYTYKGEKKS